MGIGIDNGGGDTSNVYNTVDHRCENRAGLLFFQSIPYAFFYVQMNKYLGAID